MWYGNNKLDELEASIDMNDPDIIVLTEVLPKNNRYTLQKSELETKGYTLFINNFETFRIRGVAIYIKKGITANQIHPTNCADDTAWVEIKMKNKEKMIIGEFTEAQIALDNKMIGCGKHY